MILPHMSLTLRLLLASVASIWTMTSAAAADRPYIPASPSLVLQRVPSIADPRVRAFDLLRAQLNRDPDDQTRALKLAEAYMDYARSTGDARYLGHAFSVIEPWLKRTPVPIPVMLVHATLLQSRHFFAESRTELQAILTRDADNAQAWLTLATVALVQGDYSSANHACVHLAAVGGDFYGLLCTAQLRMVDGHARQAYALLSFIENPGPKAPPAIKAYIEGLMAEAASGTGDYDVAEKHFKAALQCAPGDNFLLADYADFLLDRGRPREVQTLLADYTQSDTSFLRLVMAEVASHDPRAWRDIAQMQDRFAAMDQRGSHVYERENAMFALHVLHDPKRALRLAQENWRVQRAPKDMRIYLESALAAGTPHAAQPVLALLAQSHLQDPAIEHLTGQLAVAVTPPVAGAMTSTGSRP